MIDAPFHVAERNLGLELEWQRLHRLRGWWRRHQRQRCSANEQERKRSSKLSHRTSCCYSFATGTSHSEFTHREPQLFPPTRFHASVVLGLTGWSCVVRHAGALLVAALFAGISLRGSCRRAGPAEGKQHQHNHHDGTRDDLLSIPAARLRCVVSFVRSPSCPAPRAILSQA